jgi:hypothetical protein
VFGDIDVQVYELDAWFRFCDVRDVQEQIARLKQEQRRRAIGPVEHTDACIASDSPFCTCPVATPKAC